MKLLVVFIAICVFYTSEATTQNVELDDLNTVEENIDDAYDPDGRSEDENDEIGNEDRDPTDESEIDEDSSDKGRDENIISEDPEQEEDELSEGERDEDDSNDEGGDEADDDDDDEGDDAQSAPKRSYPSCQRGMCEMNITPIGCFKDNRKSPRLLPLLLDSHRDKTSHAYHGTFIDWKSYESTLRKLACDCVKIARAKKFKYIGLQYYGECWSGNNAVSNYSRNGLSKDCINGKYKPCKKGQFCIGKQHINYVYRIDPIVPECELSYEKVGCFHDPITTRPMPVLLDSHRDTTSVAYHGIKIDWHNYRKSLKILVDHCAKRAMAKGYLYFGIEYYGECWSGPSVHKTYFKYGKSNNCVNADFEKCNTKYGCLCAGKQKTLFVYRMTEGK